LVTNNKAGKFAFSVARTEQSQFLDKKFMTQEEYNFYIGVWLERNSEFYILGRGDYFKNYSKFILPVSFFPDGYNLNDEILVSKLFHRLKYIMVLNLLWKKKPNSF